MDLAGKKYQGLVILEVNGDIDTMAYSPEEAAEYENYKKENFAMGFVDAGKVSVTATKGSVQVYDENTRMMSDNLVHRSSMGLFIKKRGKRIYLNRFD